MCQNQWKDALTLRTVTFFRDFFRVVKAPGTVYYDIFDKRIGLLDRTSAYLGRRIDMILLLYILVKTVMGEIDCKIVLDTFYLGYERQIYT